MAEIDRAHYEIEYTEGISQRMRIPEKLHVAPTASDGLEGGPVEARHSILMQVPERILVAGDNQDSQYPRPRDLDLIQSTPLESLALKTPPRVLTLNDRPLDFLETERSGGSAQQGEEGRAQVRVRRERSASENALMHQNGQLTRNDPLGTAHLRAPLRPIPEDGHGARSTRGVLSMIQSTTSRAYQQVLEVLDENHCSKPVLRGGAFNPLHECRLSLSSMDTSQEGIPDDMAAGDASSLRRQILKLNRRLQLLEEENKERTKREMFMYSITVAFWIINSWIWIRR
ncbi:mitochondrial fission factor homolog B isoform X1 [Anguilla rostrata]|uniref:mitochondrial fission factor homolog B isoform X1 n=1 Tax=Anguilla rostrata TaxID=7938 RepID=UPI0030D52D3A